MPQGTPKLPIMQMIMQMHAQLDAEASILQCGIELQDKREICLPQHAR